MTLRPRIEHARAAARRLHVELGTSAPAHIDPVETARWLGIEVARGSLTGATARIYRVGPRAARIRLSEAIVQPGRWRFSIAHELGHYVLGHDLPTQLDATCARNDNYEREADVFATEHLTPESMVRAHCALSPVDLERARAIARLFAVSTVAAALRLVELSAVPSAVVYSVGGLVKWTRPSRTFRYRIPDAWRVRSPSIAFSTSETGVAPSGPASVPLRAWVPYARDTRTTLLEDAELVPEPGWGGVLSLLSMPDGPI